MLCLLVLSWGKFSNWGLLVVMLHLVTRGLLRERLALLLGGLWGGDSVPRWGGGSVPRWGGGMCTGSLAGWTTDATTSDTGWTTDATTSVAGAPLILTPVITWPSTCGMWMIGNANGA